MARLISLLLCLALAGCSTTRDTEVATSPSDTPRSASSSQSTSTEAGTDTSTPLGSGEILYEEGISPLTRAQEDIIHTYMIRAYEALARLE